MAAPTGDGGAEESKGGEPGPGVPLQLFPLPPGVTVDTVVPEVALLHILAEEKRWGLANRLIVRRAGPWFGCAVRACQLSGAVVWTLLVVGCPVPAFRYRELPVMPTLADPVLGGAIRKWLDGSETALRKGLVDLLPAPADADVGTSQVPVSATRCTVLVVTPGGLILWCACVLFVHVRLVWRDGGGGGGGGWGAVPQSCSLCAEYVQGIIPAPMFLSLSAGCAGGPHRGGACSPAGAAGSFVQPLHDRRPAQ